MASQKLWGMLSRRERWSLSWRGRLFVTSVGLVAAYLAFLSIHPFLAVTHRVNTKVLVVEGWVAQYAIQRGAEAFKNGSYERIFTTGGPVNGNGGYTNDYNTSASVGAEILKKFGVPDDLVQMVPSRVIGRERTYSSAVALRDWFRDRNLAIQSFNVLTQDCHARRTRLLYQEAFGKKVTVGVIAVSNPDYNPKDWWRYSDGVREVVSESIAYIYARFFFYPSRTEANDVNRADSRYKNEGVLHYEIGALNKACHGERIFSSGGDSPLRQGAPEVGTQ
jgi:hypothetical protein